MKAYDILVILKAHMGDDETTKRIDQLKSWITENEGDIVHEDTMGLRDMPETFKPAQQGYYFNAEFNGTNKTLDTIKSKIAVSEDVLRYMIVTVDSIRSKKVAEEKEAA